METLNCNTPAEWRVVERAIRSTVNCEDAVEICRDEAEVEAPWCVNFHSRSYHFKTREEARAYCKGRGFLRGCAEVPTIKTSGEALAYCIGLCELGQYMTEEAAWDHCLRHGMCEEVPHDM